MRTFLLLAWTPETNLSVVLLCGFTAIVTLIAGSAWNLHDGWTRPVVRYGHAFGWALVALAAMLISVEFL